MSANRGAPPIAINSNRTIQRRVHRFIAVSFPSRVG
jgi:hypothetical protein